MGCDIHGWAERKIDGRWVGLRRFTHEKAGTRHYKRFAALAGVRGDGPGARGFPEDASAASRYEFEGWGADAHSASWLPLKDACEAYLKATFPGEVISGFARAYPASEFFDVDGEGADLDDWRIVFWFDN